MKKLLLIPIILFVGCATPSIPLPEMPTVKTQKGRDCIRVCQRDHNACYDAIEGSLSVGVDYQRAEYASQCNQKLSECYQLCEIEDK